MRRESISDSLDSHEHAEPFQPRQCSVMRRDVPSKKELRQTCLNRDKRKPVEIYPEREPDISIRNILI